MGNTEPSRGKTPEGVETRRSDLIHCPVCKEDKPVTEFYKKDRPHGREDRDATCKACRIIRQRERNLGVTQEQYLEMLRKQASKCGICNQRLRSKRYKAFAVDHCHTTGRIRGLLCGTCNSGIGMLKDDPILLARAVEWVKV